jgi:general secretion pathway protein K
MTSLRFKRIHASPRRNKQAGVALITVLLVFAIATLIASKIIIGKVLDVQRTTGMINRTQAYYYAVAAEELTILALEENANADADPDNMPQGDHLDEFWAQGPIPFEIDNIGAVLVQIIDLNRYYNINNIIQSDGKVSLHELDRFKDLLIELNLDESIADNLADWLDADDSEQGYPSEKDGYLNEQPGYLAANRMLSDISELRLVRGFTPEVMNLLNGHITAVKVPGVLPLNMNTASEYALSTLQVKAGGASSGTYNGIGTSGAQDIIGARITPYTDLSDVASRVGISNLQSNSVANTGTIKTGPGDPLSTYTVSSNFFEVHIRASYAGSVAYLSTTIAQQGAGSFAKFVVLQRKETDNSAHFINAASN